MTTHPTPPPPTTGTAAGLEPAPDVLDGEVLDGPNYTRRPLPAVLPTWLGSRRTAAATMRWAVRYAARHVGFHLVRAPGYALALAWWMLRGTTRALAAGFGWISARSEYRPVITAAREANRWDLVLDLITERRALARVRISTTAWLTLSAAATSTAGVLALGTPFAWCAALVAALAAAWLGRPVPSWYWRPARCYQFSSNCRRTCSPPHYGPPGWSRPTPPRNWSPHPCEMATGGP